MGKLIPKHLIDVYIPYMTNTRERLKEAFQALNLTDTDLRAMAWVDGGDLYDILKGHIIAIFDTLNADLGKVAANNTKTGQASDAGTMFLNTKSPLRHHSVTHATSGSTSC